MLRQGAKSLLPLRGIRILGLPELQRQECRLPPQSKTAAQGCSPPLSISPHRSYIVHVYDLLCLSAKSTTPWHS